MQQEKKSHFFVHLVESNNLVNRSYGFFYTVIVHNVLTIANSCYMFSFFPNVVPLEAVLKIDLKIHWAK